MPPPDVSDSPPQVALREEMERLRRAEEGPSEEAFDRPYPGAQDMGDPPPPPIISPRKPEAIEDLYAFYPQIGNSNDFSIRVERLEPKAYNGQSTAGWLGDFQERIEFGDMMARFGGHRYKVSVVGPLPNARKRGDGSPVMRILTSVDVRIPGPPNLRTLPRSDQMMSSMEAEMAGAGNPYAGRVPAGFTGFVPAGMSPQVEVAKIESENARWRMDHEDKRDLQRRILERADSAGSAPTQLLDAIKEQSTTAIERMERVHQQQLEILQSQLNDAKERSAKLEDEVRRVREKATEDRLNDITHRKENDAEILARASETHERELRRLNDEHRQALERLTSQQREDTADFTNRHTEELRRMESEGVRERERLMRDASERETRLKDDYGRERQQMKETYEARLADLDRSFAREVATLRDVQGRELQAYKTQFETQAALSKETAHLRIENNQGEVARLRAEAERLRNEAREKTREIEDLRRSSMKEPIAALGEARTLLESVGLEIKAPGSGDGESEEKGDWKTLVINGLREALPKGLEAVGRMREGNQQQIIAQQQSIIDQQQRQMQGQGMPPQQQRRALPGRGGRMAQMPMHTPVTAGPVAPPLQLQNPSVSFQPLSPQPALQPLGSYNPSMHLAPLLQPQAAQQGHASGSVDDVLHGSSQLVAVQQPEQQQAPQPQQQAAAPQQQAGQQVADGAVEFIQQLELAINAGYPAPDFAKAFIEKVGVENASVTVSNVSLEGEGGFFQLVESARNQGMPFGKQIITRDGQKYVREVWEQTKQQLRAVGAQVS